MISLSGFPHFQINIYLSFFACACCFSKYGYGIVHATLFLLNSYFCPLVRNLLIYSEYYCSQLSCHFYIPVVLNCFFAACLCLFNEYMCRMHKTTFVLYFYRTFKNIHYFTNKNKTTFKKKKKRLLL